MNLHFKKWFAGLTAGVMLLSSASCGMLEMRGTETESEAEETTPLMLAPAQRTNELETRAETEPPVLEEPAASVTFCLTGDIRIDESIIHDAANRAPEGKSYGFIRMYTGVFRSVSCADIALGSYSAADIPCGSDGSRKTPVESLAALSDIGFDVLDTSYTGNDSAEMESYDIADIAVDEEIRYLEQNGITTAYVSLAVSDTDKVEAASENADMVIVSFSWKQDTDSTEQKKIASALAQAGADVIVGDGLTLGSVEWIDTGDGTPTLAAYSLGSLLTTSDNPYALCGGILEFTAEETDDGVIVKNPVLSPTVVRYTKGGSDYQLILLSDYKEALSSDHAVAGTSAEALISFVRDTVTTEFLSPALRG